MRYVKPHSTLFSWSLVILLSAVMLTCAGCGQPAPPQPAPQPGETARATAPTPQESLQPEPSALALAGVLPLAGEALDKQIVFFFTEPVQVAPEAGYSEPFTIDPPVQGVFRISGNFVAFRAADGFAENTLYTVDLNPDLVSASGARIPEVARRHRFATFIFEPQQVWEIEDQPDRVVLGILFPTTVNFDSLREHLSVESQQDQPVEYALESGEDGVVRLVFAEGLAEPIVIKISKGVEDETGTTELETDHTFTYPEEPFFSVTSIQWGQFEGPKKEIVLQFTKPVAAESLATGVSIARTDNQSAVPFEIASRGTRTEHRIQVDLSDGDFPSLTVQLAKDMPGSQGRHLVEGYEATLATRPDPLTVASVRWSANRDWNEQLFLKFSHPVRNEALADRLKLTDTATGDNLTFSIQGEALSVDKTVQFEPVTRDMESVTLAIEAGLPGEPNAVLNEPYQYEATRPVEPLRLEDTWWGEDSREGLFLTMRLNAAVSSQELEKHLAFTPAVEDIRIVPTGNNYFRILGTFRSKTAYQLHIAEGVTYAGGAKSQEALTRELQTEQVPSYVGFNHDGKFYFPTRATSALAVKSRNVEKVSVEIYRMFPSNVAVAVSDMGMSASQDDYWESQRFGSNFIHKWSEKLGSSELEMPTQQDVVVSAALNLEGLLPSDKRGVFCVQARSDRGHSASKIVLFTDIGVMAHWQNNELMLFAHNLFSLEPLAGAKVTLHSNKNQLLAIGHTNTQGILHMSNLDTNLGNPAVAVVEHGDDCTLIELKRSNDATPEILPGMPGYDRDGYDGFIYADRDLYRPGETVHARWIVRTNYGDALAETPLLLKVLKPNGRELMSRITNLTAFGSGELDIETQKEYPTGKYTIALEVPGSKTPVGTYQFSLEEFVPNRIETKVELPLTVWLAGQSYEIHVEARHLFGAPAVNRMSNAKVALERKGWSPAGWEGYRFENDSKFKPDTIPVGEKQTDSNGKTTFTFSHAAPPDATSPLTATVFAGVFELGGRAVYGTAQAVYFPSGPCLGLRVSKPEGGAGIEASVAAVNPDGTPAELEQATVYLEKQVWNYYVRRYYSHYDSNWTESFDPITSKEVALQGGKGSVTFDLSDWGYYRLRVVSDKTKQFSTATFYSYGGQVDMVSTARPSLIKLSLDKALYTIGETATLKVESPFDGQGIVTVQGDSLQDMIPVTIVNNVGQIELPVTEAHFPNVWLEVTVLHAIESGKTQMHPFSSFALTSVNVENPARKLAVAFPDLPEEVRPAGQREFTVQVSNHEGNPVEAEVTLAAVDEGIHDITDYQNPAPYEHFSRPRRPDFRRAHYYDKVAYDFDKPEVGGDALRQLAKRSGAADESWIKPVALWSGVVHTGADGTARVLMDVPEFSGQLRLVAVACTTSAAGASGNSVYVRRPYMLRTSLPRFLLPGDAATCRAVLFNTTDAPCTVALSSAVTGPLQIAGEPKTVTVPANSEASVEIPLRATEVIGQGNIRWEAVVADAQGSEVERLVQETPLPVKPPAAFQSHHELTQVAPGMSQTFKNTRFIANDQSEMEIVVSANPQTQLYESLKYLVHYPYGCAEQTTSALMPIYVLRKSQKLVEEVMKDRARLDDYIKGGIARLFAMQTASGGLGYWPGSVEPYPYGSVYGLHFLTLVQNGREFELPELPLEALKNYVRGIANDWTQKHTKSNLYLRAYATYVLSLGGDLNAIQQIRRFDSITIPRSARYLLAAALARATQDKDRVALYLASTPSEPYAIAERGGTLNSDIRNTAVEVLSLTQIDPASNELHDKARELIRYLSSERGWNPQAEAFVASALSDYFESAAVSADQAAATIVGPNGQQTLQRAEIYRDKHEGPGGEYTITNTGLAVIYVNLTTAGVPEQPGITIARRYLTSRGDAYKTDAGFLQSDSYVVELTITPKEGVENVVVVDKLPAGFEIENPRLNAETLPPGVFKAATNPSYVDVRDDRIVLAFNKLTHKSEGHRYYYVVRAVTPGAYQAPPATTECMYDASVRAASPMGRVEVKSRQ
jgi:hypothetical protein